MTASEPHPTPGEIRNLLVTDQLIDMLEDRITALEEIAAAGFPRRVFAARRLRRQLRASIRNFSGATFADRRSAAVGTEWDAGPAPRRGQP